MSMTRSCACFQWMACQWFAEPDCGAECTTELRFAGWTSKTVDCEGWKVLGAVVIQSHMLTDSSFTQRLKKWYIDCPEGAVARDVVAVRSCSPLTSIQYTKKASEQRRQSLASRGLSQRCSVDGSASLNGKRITTTHFVGMSDTSCRAQLTQVTENMQYSGAEALPVLARMSLPTMTGRQRHPATTS
jgi:hypothetical protein